MNKLKMYRKKYNLTQKEVASYLKITQPNYANIENNKVKLNIDYAFTLAKLYKITLSDLLENDSNLITLSKEEFKILEEAKNLIINIEKKHHL